MKRRVPLREPVGVALETLRAHKLRSFLMLLGIILSVATLIVVIALISGVNQYIADKVANLGSNAFSRNYGDGRAGQGHPAEQTSHLG
jgi:ABC-type lipoprotein release transport system permease subunit